MANKKLAIRVGKWKFVRAWFRRHEKRCLKYMRRECYVSINTLPIICWHTIYEKSDFTHLLKEPRALEDIKFYRSPFFRFFGIFPKRFTKADKLRALVKIWQAIKDEKIKVFGWGEDLEKRLRLQRDYILAYCNLIESRNNRYLTDMQRAEKALQALADITPNTMSIYEQCGMLENICKTTIDLDKCSVAKFFGYINMAQSIAETMKNNGK